MNETVRAYARQLGLPTFAKADDLLRAAREGAWSHEDFLAQIMAGELTQRKENRLQRLVRSARFPLQKTLDTFDFKRLRNLDAERVWQLAGGEFVKRRENIIAIGNPGTGKTHLAIGLGRRLCREGFKVRFHTAAQLVEELAEAQEFKRLSRLQTQLFKAEVLILDELSYLTFSKVHAELLFHVLSGRNERGSVIITTNLEFSRWGELFPDTIGGAVMRVRLYRRWVFRRGPAGRIARLHEEFSTRRPRWRDILRSQTKTSEKRYAARRYFFVRHGGLANLRRPDLKPSAPSSTASALRCPHMESCPGRRRGGSRVKNRKDKDFTCDKCGRHVLKVHVRQESRLSKEPRLLLCDSC